MIFKESELEIIRFTEEDILTTSTGGHTANGYDNTTNHEDGNDDGFFQQ